MSRLPLFGISPTEIADPDFSGGKHVIDFIDSQYFMSALVNHGIQNLVLDYVGFCVNHARDRQQFAEILAMNVHDHSTITAILDELDAARLERVAAEQAAAKNKEK